MASFSDLDTLRQMGLVSLIYNGNHQLCLKFACAGTGITFTGSMDSALIISAIKQQMTVDNIGLQGVVGPMGGMMTEYVPPALPTVTKEYLYPSTTYGKIINVSSGSTCNVWRMSSGFVYSGVTYDDTTKKQCIFGWLYYESSTWYAFYGGIETLNDQGDVKAKNTTSGTIKVFEWRYAECSSSSATVITVYDSNNNPYNAFQYTSDGTDYYYVLDGTQTDWTDNLSSIGYKLPIVGWLGDDKQPKTVNGNGKHLYDTRGDYIWYESPFNSFTYTILGFYSSESGRMQSPITGLSIGGTPAGSSGGILDIIYYPGYSSSITIQRVIYFKTPTA